MGFAPGDKVYYRDNSPMQLPDGTDISILWGTHFRAVIAVQWNLPFKCERLGMLDFEATHLNYRIAVPGLRKMTYEEFYYSIDCQFPYHDEEAWKKIIAQSHDIGADAPFLVLHEICRLPSSEKLDEAVHLKMYEFWKSSFNSPVQEIIEPACLAHIKQYNLSGKETLEIMAALRPFPKNYNALLVVIFACPDGQESVENKYEEIVAEWKEI